MYLIFNVNATFFHPEITPAWGGGTKVVSLDSLLDSVGEGEGGMIWESSIETVYFHM